MRAHWIKTIAFCLLMNSLAAWSFPYAEGESWQKHNHFWVSKSDFIDSPTGVGEIHDVLCQDINGDGLLDRLYAHPNGLIAEFGDFSPSGWSDPTPLVLPALSGFPSTLFPSEKFLSTRSGEGTPWSMDGELNRDQLPAFWCRWTGPDRVLGFRVDGTRAIATFEVKLSPTQLIDVTPGGLVYGPDDEGKVYLDEYGVRRILTSHVPPLDWMKWSDVDGDGESDLVVKKREGGLGVMRMEKGRVHALEWLDQTELLDHWFFLREENGRLSIFGRMTGVQEEFKWILGDDKKWSIERMAQSGWFNDLTMVRAEEVGNGLTYTLAVSRPWRTTVGAIWRFGKCLAQFELEHSDVLGSPHFSDMNGDGLLDFVFWDERAQQLVCHYLLKNPLEADHDHSMAELVLLDRKDSMVMERVTKKFINQLPHAEESAILEALSGKGELEALQVKSGAFEACGVGFCQQMEPTLPLMPEPDVDQNGCGSEFKLNVPSSYSTPDGATWNNCLQQGEWNHIVYTRDKDFACKLYINNELAQEGVERVMDFDYKILSIGAEGGHVPHRFLDGDIDEIEVVQAVLDSAEIAQRFESQTVISHARSILVLDFGVNPNRRHPYGTDDLNITGAIETAPGVHGMGLRLDGESGRATVFKNIPNSDFSISLWVKPRGLVSAPTRPGTIVSIYGKRNLDLELLPLHRSGVFERQALKMTNAHVEKPEDGMVFSSRGDMYFLSRTGRVSVRRGFDWHELASPNVPKNMSMLGRPWFVDDELQALMGRNGTHMALDLKSMAWSQKGRLNSLIGPVESTIRTSRGTLIITRSESDAERGAFWWPHGATRVHPVRMPSSGESIVAVMNALGRFVWVHESGKESRVQLDLGAMPLSLYEKDMPGWSWFAGGALFFLIGAGTWRVRNHQNGSNDAFGRIWKASMEPSDPILNALPVHKDVLNRLRHAENHLLDVQGLDDAFLIGDIETDETRRSRRARMIKDLNVWWHERTGHDLILRDVDETDKRRRIYKLDPMYDNWYDENERINERLI